MDLIRRFKGRNHQWISSFPTKEQARNWAKKFVTDHYRIVENPQGIHLYVENEKLNVKLLL